MAKCSKLRILYLHQPYNISNYPETYTIAVDKLHNRKTPGRDLIVGYCYEKLSFYKKPLICIFRNTMEGPIDTPNWLSIVRANHVAKTEIILSVE